MPSRFLKSISLFGQEVLSDPRRIGATCPSGPWLGRRMASHIPADHRGPIIELGAGTGPVTRALLDSGIPPERLFPVEQSPRLAEHLQKRFPGVQIIRGDARHLGAMLEEHTREKVRYIVSCLPFRSLPPEPGEAILQEAARVLGEGGRFIQFTYDLRNCRFPLFRRFTLESTSVVWNNLPPARVNVYRTGDQQEVPP